MSTLLVKVENTINPPTGRREARSIATAPPSDQPAGMTIVGSILQVATR